MSASPAAVREALEGIRENLSGRRRDGPDATIAAPRADGRAVR